MNVTNSKYILLLGLKISCQDGRHQKEDAEHEGEEKKTKIRKNFNNKDRQMEYKKSLQIGENLE